MMDGMRSEHECVWRLPASFNSEKLLNNEQSALRIYRQCYMYKVFVTHATVYIRCGILQIHPAAAVGAFS